jgi:hypothetical protein
MKLHPIATRNKTAFLPGSVPLKASARRLVSNFAGNFTS